MDHVIIGVDTHKDNHIAVAIDAQGARLGSTTISTTRKGYQDLEIWAAQFGQVKAWGLRILAHLAPVCPEICWPRVTRSWM